jgi:hypothetical protein
MKNLFNNISQEEKNRILEMHSSKKNVVSEQTSDQVVNVVAGAVGGGIGALITSANLIANGAGTSDQKVKALCNLCKKSKTQVTQTGNRMADAIRDSVQGMGTNEKKINNVFTSLRSFDDFCSLVRAYQASYSTDLYSDLDADIDSESEWVTIFRPIRDLLLKAKQQVVKPTPQTTRPAPQPGQGTRPTPQPAQGTRPAPQPGQGARPTSQPAQGTRPAPQPGQGARPTSQPTRPTAPQPGQGARPTSQPTRPTAPQPSQVRPSTTRPVVSQQRPNYPI